jgi:hypothetical protein
MKIKNLLFISVGLLIAFNLSFSLSPKKIVKNDDLTLIQPSEPGNGYTQTLKVCSGQLYDCCKKGPVSSICSLSLQTPSETACYNATNQYTEDVTCPAD